MFYGRLQVGVQQVKLRLPGVGRDVQEVSVHAGGGEGDKGGGVPVHPAQAQQSGHKVVIGPSGHTLVCPTVKVFIGIFLRTLWSYAMPVLQCEISTRLCRKNGYLNCRPIL